MKKSPFLLLFNSTARQLLFADGQTAIRINTEENEISFKSGKNTKAADAIAVNVKEAGSIPAYIMGPHAGLFAKLLKKVGLTPEQPYALLIKGNGGWYHLKHAPDMKKSPPNIPAIRADIPEFLEEVFTEAAPRAKRGRKPNPNKIEKPKKPATVKIGGITMKKKPIQAAEYSDESFEGWEKRILASMSTMVAAAETKKAGRPSSELVHAQNTVYRAQFLLGKMLGVPDYESLISEINGAIGNLQSIRDALIGFSSKQNEISQIALNIANESAKAQDELEDPPLPADEQIETEAPSESTSEDSAIHEDVTAATEEETVTETVAEETVHSEPVPETEDERIAREAAATKSSKTRKHGKERVSEAA